YILEDSSFPLEYVNDILSKADPTDDRVWLGRANAALWQGRTDESARWLDGCEKRRPYDQAMWLSRLSLARAACDLMGARRAVEHLDSSWFLPYELLQLRAWFASVRSLEGEERRYLTSLVAEQPGNTSAWARLAELSTMEGRQAEADAFRSKQA